MKAEPISVVENWLAIPDDERAGLTLGQVFGQVRLDVLDDIREEASTRAQQATQDRIGGVPARQFWSDVARLAELVSFARLTAAGFLPDELADDQPCKDIIEADRAYLRAEGLISA